MGAGDQSVNEEGLIAQGRSGALQEDGSLYKANLRNTRHCQPRKIRFNLESQHIGVFFLLQILLIQSYLL